VPYGDDAELIPKLYLLLALLTTLQTTLLTFL